MPTPKPVYLCNKITMKVIKTYPSADDAEKTTGDHGIQDACRYRRVGYGKHVWRYVDDYDPNESFEGKHNRPVVCKDIIDNKIAFYDTMSAAEKEFSLARGVISSAMRKGFKVLGRYRFKYAR